MNQARAGAREWRDFPAHWHRGGTKDSDVVVTGASADTTTRTSRREAGVEVAEV